MVHVVTYIDIDPKSIAEGLALLKSYRSQGDAIVLQETNRRNRFAMIEVWNDEGAFQAHEGSPRVAEFRSRLRAIHNSPYDQRVHHTFAAGPQREAGDGMLYCVTHVDVPPPRPVLPRLPEASAAKPVPLSDRVVPPPLQPSMDTLLA